MTKTLGAEGLTPRVLTALGMFHVAVIKAYGPRVAQVAVFGSRARGDARPGSDLDVAVVLTDHEVDGYGEKMKMADIAYDATVATGVHVQPWPVGAKEWEFPGSHRNSALVHAMRQDGLKVRVEDGRAVCQGR